MDIKEFITALEILEREKGIEQKSIIEAFEQAIANGYQREQKDINKDALYRAKLDLDTGNIQLWAFKTIVEAVAPQCDSFEISIDEAKQLNSDAALGDEIEVPIDTPSDISRMAISHTKQILRQKLREAERQAIYDQYSDKVSEIIVATVEKVEPGFVTVDLGKTYAVMKRNNLIINEHLTVGQHIKVFVSSVEGSGGNQITVSRTDPGLIRRLFEQEIHEVYDGTIVIKAIVREAGFRTKVAVTSANPNIDATGSCIGPRGSRVINVSSQINGEKIDVIEYFDDAAMFILEAVKPAIPVGVSLLEGQQAAIVIVKSADLSQAIGRNGINVRLASKITGWNLDVKTEEWAAENNCQFSTPDVIKVAYFKKMKEKARIDREERELQESLNNVDKELEVVADYDDYIPETSTKKPDADIATIIPEPIVATIPVAPVAKPVEMPKAPEKKVIIRQETKIKLSDLEKQLEEERQQIKTTTPAPRKRYEKEKDKEEKVDKKEVEEKKLREEELARSYMPIYTEEELKEIEEAEEDDSSFDSDEDYDNYYEEE